MNSSNRSSHSHKTAGTRWLSRAVIGLVTSVMLALPSMANAKNLDSVNAGVNTVTPMSNPSFYSDAQVGDNYYVDAAVQDPALIVNELGSSSAALPGVFNLFSHGRAGALLIDGQWLSGESLVDFLKPKLKGYAQLSIYGCDFAAGEEGKQAVSSLEAALGISIAASDDISGKNGDWDLEVGQGTLASAISLSEEFKDLYAYNLQWEGTLSTDPLARDRSSSQGPQVINVYAEEGEIINVQYLSDLCAYPSTTCDQTVRMTWTAPDGTTGTTVTSVAGVLTSDALPVVTTATEGIWQLVMDPVGTDFVNSLYLWDVSVQNAGVFQPGRTYVDRLQLFNGRNDPIDLPRSVRNQC